LRKHRKIRPVEGLIVTIDITRLLQGKEGAAEEEAKVIRERITEMISELGGTFPVYLVFTKCDLIYGFQQFFEGLSNAERSQILGSTLKTNLQEKADVVFREECRSIFESLNKQRMARLASARTQGGGAVYNFPMQLEQVQDKLAPFVGALFPSISKEKPIFRGFYFTSGTQGQGDGVEFVLSQVAKSVNGQAAPLDDQTPVEAAKGYFVKDMFSKVMFPDRGLDRPTSATERRSNVIRLSICGGILAILAIFAIILSITYVKSRNLMTKTERSAVAVAQIDSSTDQMTRLERHENLRKPIARLERFAFFSFPWLGPRRRVAADTRKVYLTSMYGSSSGWETNLSRNIKIPVKVLKYEGDSLEPIKKVDIKVTLNEKNYNIRTRKDGTASFKTRVKDGKVAVKFSTEYEEPGYEPQEAYVYEVQPGETVSKKGVQFIFSKSARVINIHCTGQAGNDLSGVPISIIEQADESKKYGPETSNEQGVAQLRLEAQQDTVLLIYYGESANSYPEGQPDTVTIKSGQSRYSIEKQLRRKIEISVIAYVKAADGDTQQSRSGVSVSVGKIKLGLTDNSGQWSGTSDTIPTKQNMIADPNPEEIKIEKTVSGYSIVLEYEGKPTKPPVDENDKPKPPVEQYFQIANESGDPIVGAEVWVYDGADGDENQIKFEAEGKEVILVRIDSVTDNDGRVKLPAEASDHQLRIWHEDYWPQDVAWKQVTKPAQMTSIETVRSYNDFDKTLRDGAEIFYEVAQKYENEENLKLAVMNYERTIRLFPRLKYYLKLGWAYYENGQIEAALKQDRIGLVFELTDDTEANVPLLRQQLRELSNLLQ